MRVVERTWLSVARAVVGVCVLVGCSTAGFAAPAVAERYTSTTAHPDGLGKVYMGREISQIMGFQGAAWLERIEREKEERGDLMLTELRLQPGMNVADIGAGTGYYTRRIAPRVGPQGKVYAVDVQPPMVRMLETAARQPGLSNIVPILGAADDTRLPARSIDLALMVDVYHELEFPHEVLASVVRSLRPGGRVVFVEYRGEDPSVPIKSLHKMTEAQVRLEASQHPLVWERTATTLPWQHLIVFRAAP